VHDYFDILGVSPDARASEIRQACARHAPRPHPDFAGADRADSAAPRQADADPRPEVVDVAIDVPDVASILDRARAAFFRSGS
jgi:hypothetical protein